MTGAQLLQGQNPAALPVFTEDEQRAVLAMVIADAIAYRMPGFRPDCVALNDGTCPDHAADLDRTDAYLRLAADLWIEVEP